MIYFQIIRAISREFYERVEIKQVNSSVGLFTDKNIRVSTENKVKTEIADSVKVKPATDSVDLSKQGLSTKAKIAIPVVAAGVIALCTKPMGTKGLIMGAVAGAALGTGVVVASSTDSKWKQGAALTVGIGSIIGMVGYPDPKKMALIGIGGGIIGAGYVLGGMASGKAKPEDK